MNGILNVYKEKGLTSHDVINRVRRIFKTKQVGHTGTLDPNAEGVLVVCLNQATKLVQFLEGDNKKYRCELIIGLKTDTYDITGNKLLEVKNPFVDEALLLSIINSFIGKQKQVPPIYSAIKVDGKKLYEYARDNQTVDLKARDIEIFDLQIVKPLVQKGDYLSIWFEVSVSKGTYIRSLCNDIGEKLQIPCTMGDLLRLKSGNFSLEKATTLSEIEEGNYNLVSMIDALDLPKIEVEENSELLHKVINGMKISLKAFSITYEKFIVIKNNELLAIYEKFDDDKFSYYRAVRVWK